MEPRSCLARGCPYKILPRAQLNAQGRNAGHPWVLGVMPEPPEGPAGFVHTRLGAKLGAAGRCGMPMGQHGKGGFQQDALLPPLPPAVQGCFLFFNRFMSLSLRGGCSNTSCFTVPDDNSCRAVSGQG